jgi:uncharacterized membrane protein
MQLLRALIVLAAVGFAAAQVYQERRRLARIERLPGPEGRELHEAARRRAERAMTILAATLAALGVAAIVDLLTRSA